MRKRLFSKRFLRFALSDHRPPGELKLVSHLLQKIADVVGWLPVRVLQPQWTDPARSHAFLTLGLTCSSIIPLGNSKGKGSLVSGNLKFGHLTTKTIEAKLAIPLHPHGMDRTMTLGFEA